MKILQIHNFYKNPGGEDVVLNAEKHILTKHGHHVEQLTRNNNIEIKNFNDYFKVLLNVSYSKKSINILKNFLDTYSPDIVHLHNLFPLWSYSIIEFLKNRNIPIIMTLHNYRILWDVINIYEKNYPYYDLFKNSKLMTFFISKLINKKKNLLINHVNKFITFNEFSHNEFLKAGIDKNKISIKPNFLIDKKIKILSLNKKKDAIYAGRISHEKGILTLLKSWKNFNIKLNVYGDGPLLKKLKNTEFVKFHGQKKFNEIDYEISKAKILIFPSQVYETMGMSILQAFRAGTLVIASNLGAMKSIIKDKFNGILFEPGNSYDLEKKLNWVINNPLECETITKNALNDFNLKYSENVNYEKLIDIYQKIINKNLLNDNK